MQRPSPESTKRALYACDLCKKRKRKCDRKLPECTVCVGSRQECHYRRPKHPTGVNSSQAIDGFKTQPLSQQDPAVKVYFLDYDVFYRGQMQIPDIKMTTPQYVLSLLGDRAGIQQTAMEFFGTIHPWMSMISKKRFYHHILNPLIPTRADFVLLFLCMKLITWVPSDEETGPRTPLYLAAKQYYMEIETAGTFTLQAMQAGLLIGLYEVAHALYPSASLSIAASARYGLSLGLDWRSAAKAPKPLSWIELEEQRRVWWTVIILERFLNLGCPGCLATEDPGPDDLLPADDQAWDQGVIKPNDTIALSLPATLNMGRFARIAHATHLLCRVFRHASDPPVDKELHEKQEIQLERTILALIRISGGEARSRQSGQAAIGYSALIALHTPSLTAMDGATIDSARRDHAKKVIGEASKKMAEVAQAFFDGFGLPVEQISPLILHWLYHAAASYVRMNREHPDDESEVALNVLKQALKVLDTRWKLAGMYLQILEAREVINTC